MTQKFNETRYRTHSGSFIAPMLVGATIALALIILFLSGVDSPDPEWGRYWMVKPMLVMPFAGAMGGLFYHYMGHLRVRGGWNRFLADLISLLVFIIGLWLGSVLGLNGTLWN